MEEMGDIMFIESMENSEKSTSKVFVQITMEIAVMKNFQNKTFCLFYI